MPTRTADPNFQTDERLWRRVGKRDLRAGGTVKGSALRLQISVVRERFGAIERVPQGDRNGVAETTAIEAASISEDVVKVVCIDEPTPEEDGHALIALVVHPGDVASWDLINGVRQMVAGKLRVVVAPTSV